MIRSLIKVVLASIGGILIYNNFIHGLYGNPKINQEKKFLCYILPKIKAILGILLLILAVTLDLLLDRF